MKIKDAIEWFIQDREISDLSNRTIEFYDYVLQRFLKARPEATFEDLELQIRSYLHELTKSEMAPSSVHAQFRGLRAWVRFCERQSWCDRILLPTIKRVKVKKEPLTHKEMTRLLKACRGGHFTGIRNQAILRCFFDMGLRLGELVNMQDDSIDWKDRVVEILGKGNKTRWVPFGRATKAALWAYMTKRKSFKNYDPYLKYLWLANNGQQITKNGVVCMLHKLEVKTGIHVHPHKLRHSMAFAFIRAGGDIRTSLSSNFIALF